MRKPEVGEYWYIGIRVISTHTFTFETHEYDDIVLAKCVSSNIFKYRDYYITTNTVIYSKWEPNWFWKFLGYK